MEPNNPDGSRSFGRGRPVESADLRRPFGYTYTRDPSYVPAEGSGNVLQLNNPMGDLARQHIAQNGDASMLHAAPSDHAGSQNFLNSTDSDKVASEMKSVLSPYAPEFVPRNFRPETRTNPSQISASNTADPNDTYPIQKLRQFLFEITLNPGKYESKIEQLVDLFNDYIMDDDTMRAVVNIIFDESVRQPNFRYSGARLSQHLCKDLSVPSERMTFFQLLILRCNQEHKRREDLVNGEDDGAYLRGFALYLAELFSQLELSNQKIKVLGDYLTSLIETLLSKPSPDNLKCICQILKLVGLYLEDQEKKGTPNSSAEMDKIMQALGIIANNKDFTNDIRNMVSNVVDLRSCDWGRACEEESVVQELPPTTSLNEPVMYGPDGKPITDEESLFLHSQYSNSASDGEEYDNYEDGAYDEMEDELQAAYEDYLNLIDNNTIGH